MRKPKPFTIIGGIWFNPRRATKRERRVLGRYIRNGYISKPRADGKVKSLGY